MSSAQDIEEGEEGSGAGGVLLSSLSMMGAIVGRAGGELSSSACFVIIFIIIDNQLNCGEGRGGTIVICARHRYRYHHRRSARLRGGQRRNRCLPRASSFVIDDWHNCGLSLSIYFVFSSSFSQLSLPVILIFLSRCTC